MSRRPVAAPVIVLLVGIGLVSASDCFISRQSDSFLCASDADCHDGRTCDRGYCVEVACPPVCTECDHGARTCTIECDSGTACGAIACPAGFDCTIRCSATGACGDIDCTSGGTCDIRCSQDAACGAIRCGDRACAIACDAPGSCPSIACADSCACGVTCDAPANCPSMACPAIPVLGPCTENQASGAPCSTSPLGCDTCF